MTSKRNLTATDRETYSATRRGGATQFGTRFLFRPTNVPNVVARRLQRGSIDYAPGHDDQAMDAQCRPKRVRCTSEHSRFRCRASRPVEVSNRM